VLVFNNDVFGERLSVRQRLSDIQAFFKKFSTYSRSTVRACSLLGLQASLRDQLAVIDIDQFVAASSGGQCA